jgi:hypothetical protein
MSDSEQNDLFGRDPAAIKEPAVGRYEVDDNCTVVRLQCPIEVFTNEAAGVTIRQDQTGAYGGTVFIWMNDSSAVRCVIRALQREIGDID